MFESLEFPVAKLILPVTPLKSVSLMMRTNSLVLRSEWMSWM